MERAWDIYLPTLNIKDALQQLDQGRGAQPQDTYEEVLGAQDAPQTAEATDESSRSPFVDPDNVEDYEFDESQEFDNSTDGMGFLVADSKKSGYMGPQSGVRSLPIAFF